MARPFRTDDWNSYRMDYKDPHRALEPLEKETAVVGEALDALQQEGVLPHTRYDHQKMLAHRNAVGELFEIPWTAITPRMERLLYAVNAITRPQRMVAAGVFCGFTFISNAAAAVGPGACYSAEQLIGVEIEPDEARRAECNLRRIDPEGVARIVAADAVEFVASFQGQIGLLYLDADGAGDRGKGIYLDILETGYDRMPSGALVLAHNSANAAEQLSQYLTFVRDPANFRASVNVILDMEGLEISAK